MTCRGFICSRLKKRRKPRVKLVMLEFFFSLLVQIEERKASKAPKNRCSKNVKRTHFSGVRRFYEK
jgi:hypothetical protein